MSRRLEVIPTGFVDYGKAGESFMGGFMQGRNIVMQEQERQRIIQEREDARMAAANQLYRQNQSETERFGADLTTEEKVKFQGMFDDIQKTNRDMTALVQQGLRIGSPEYAALQDNFFKKQKTLQMSVGAIKEIKSSQSQAAALLSQGYVLDQNYLGSLDEQYNKILSGKGYVPSTDIVSKDKLTMSAYRPAATILKAYAPQIKSYTESEEVLSKDPKTGKQIKTTSSRQVPIEDNVYSLATEMVTLPPRDAAGLNKDFEAWYTNAPEQSSSYKIFAAWYKKLGKDVKSPDQFAPVDYAAMQLVARNYKPTDNEMSKISTPRAAKSGGAAAADVAWMKSMTDDFYSGDVSKRTAVVKKLKGALGLKGWTIEDTGKGIHISKTKDAYTDGIDATADYGGGDESMSTLQTAINAYGTAIGKAGKGQQ